MREKKLAQVRERIAIGDHRFCIWVLLLPLVLILSMRNLQGFLLYGFHKENICVYCLLRLIVVHVILSDKILRSYCQIDKNLTLLKKNQSLKKNYIFGGDIQWIAKHINVDRAPK